MKRLLVVLVVLSLFVPCAFAESNLEIQSMSTDMLLSLREAIDTELSKRDTNSDGVFTVEHNAEYYDTLFYIYDFLTKKGFEVQTVWGVPNIGRLEDNDPTDHYIGWFAYAKHKGQWQEFTVLLFDGEVVSAIPNKSK